MQNKVRWGIIGPGKIAHKFAADLQLSQNAILQGVASRSLNRAKAFGEKYHSLAHYGSYRELAESPDIDMVYIATPHAFHFELTMMCLENGKSVLCEKPMGMNREEVETAAAMAKSKNLFLMEGLWTRFIPATKKVIELLDSEAIGEVLFIRADFGFKGDGNPESRVFKKALGGGSLLDIGIYPIYLSQIILGSPSDIKVMARMTETEVDGYCSMLFDFDNSAKASLKSTFEANTPTEAHIYGGKGRIKMHSPFHHSQKITLIREGQEKEVFDIPHIGNGYIHEIEEVHSCLSNGDTESRRMPHHASLDLISTMDKVREKMGLSYESSQ